MHRSQVASLTALSERHSNCISSQLCNQRVRKTPVPDKKAIVNSLRKRSHNTGQCHLIVHCGVVTHRAVFLRLREVLKEALGTKAYEEGKRKTPGRHDCEGLAVSFSKTHVRSAKTVLAYQKENIKWLSTRMKECLERGDG